MPSRNTQKEYVEDAYYHIYNRGVGQQTIFKEDMDYIVFLSLLKRYLYNEPTKDSLGREYPNYHDNIQLLAFCLMSNHFHLLVHQRDKKAVTKLMQSLCTAYTMYFNRRYERVGRLFQGRFKASIITNDAYLIQISRYIHLNPDKHMGWEFSSLPYYLKIKQASWINPQPILELFDDSSYLDFIKDFAGHRQSLVDISSALADS